MVDTLNDRARPGETVVQKDGDEVLEALPHTSQIPVYDPKSPASADYGPAVGMGRGLVGRESGAASPLRSPIIGSSYDRSFRPVYGERTSPLRNTSKTKDPAEAFNRYKPIALQFLDRVSNSQIDYLENIKAASVPGHNHSPLR